MNERRNGDAIVEIDLQFSCLQRILNLRKSTGYMLQRFL